MTLQTDDNKDIDRLQGIIGAQSAKLAQNILSVPDKAAPPEALNTCGTEELGNNKAEELLPQNISDQEYTACDQQQSRMESLSILTGNSRHANRLVLLAAIFAGLGGFLFGYDVGVISGALLQLEIDFKLSDLEKELVVSLMLVGAMIASALGGYIVDFFGRRDTIIGNSIIFIVGAVFMCTAVNLELLLIGRIIVGFAVSLSATSEIIFISEIAPPTKRGMLVSVNEMGITIGIFVSYLMNYAFIETRQGWRYMFGLSIIPAIVQGIGMIFLPKSPRWLLIKNRQSLARKNLALLREGEVNIDAELDQIQITINQQKAQRLSMLFTNPQLFKCMVVGCGLVLLQQFTGQPNVLYYGSTVFKAAGFQTDKQATLANLIIGAVKVVATAIALVKVDTLGRRPLLLCGTALMILSLVVLASVTAVYPPVLTPNNGTSTNATLFLESFVNSEESNKEYNFTSTTVKWTSLASMISFVLAYSFSYGPVSWLVLSEIFPDNIRGRAVSIATIFNWGGNLVVSVSFLSLLGSIGFSGTFFLYAGIGIIALIFVFAFSAVVPETRGKTLEEISHIMQSGQSLFRRIVRIWNDYDTYCGLQTVQIKCNVD
eukprot:gene1071-4302_t